MEVGGRIIMEYFLLHGIALVAVRAHWNIGLIQLIPVNIPLMVLMMVLVLFMVVLIVELATMTRMQLMMTVAVNMRRAAATAMETPQVITATVITM